MMIPTEPIGSIPRPPELIAALAARAAGALAEHELDPLYQAAVRDTVARFEATGSPVITDGEQRKYHSFWTYPVHGAHKVQVDFTEGRLAVKLDPSGGLLNSFIDLNNLALSRFSDHQRQLIGVHACPGADCDSTHSADVDYADLLPSLFELKAGNFYVALAGEADPARVPGIIRRHLKPGQRVFVGVLAAAILKDRP